MRMLQFGLVAALVAGTATAQPPGGGRGQGGMMGGRGAMGPAQLVASKTVQEAIKATEEQVGKLKSWAADYQQKQFASMRERAADFQGLDRDEMRKKFAELQAEAGKKAYAELAEVLKPEQVARIKEIAVQAAGPQAFTMPEVQAALSPTDDQKEKLKGLMESFQKEVGELRQEILGEGRPDAAKMADFAKKQTGLNKELMGKVEGMLTADQKAAWKKLTGEPVDVAKIQQEAMASMMGKFRKKDD